MSRTIEISDELYHQLQAALLLTGESEGNVANRLFIKYVHDAFSNAMGKQFLHEENGERKAATPIDGEIRQKQLFTNWFRSLTRNGRAYQPVTISGYAGRIESACTDPAFSSVPVSNLFSVSDLAVFMDIQRQIKACPGYAEFDAKSHSGFTAALKKYEEFLQFQSNGAPSNTPFPRPQVSAVPTGVHRWTFEEDEICCKRFIQCYVLNRSNLDTAQFLATLAKEVPAISEGSLRMKIQNIKYLSMKAGLADTSAIKWLSQYSSQCKRAFNKALQDLNIG